MKKKLKIIFLSILLFIFSKISFAANDENIYDKIPIKLTENERQISRGILFTTEPTELTEFCTALIVATSLEECKNLALKAGLKLGI